MDKFGQSFYLYLETDDKEKFPTFEIKNIDDLRTNLLSWSELRRRDDYQGIDPEDSVGDALSDWWKEWDKREDVIRNGSLEDLSNFVKENNIVLSYEHPDRLTERDFEDDKNPVFVDLDDVPEWDPMDAMERAYNDRPGFFEEDAGWENAGKLKVETFKEQYQEMIDKKTEWLEVTRENPEKWVMTFNRDLEREIDENKLQLERFDFFQPRDYSADYKHVDDFNINKADGRRNIEEHKEMWSENLERVTKEMEVELEEFKYDLERGLTEMPEHNEISELKVLQSNAGYYIGREQFDKYYESWSPYIRVTGYVGDRKDAEAMLKDVIEFKKDIKDLDDDKLKVLAEAFNERLDEDPTFELKRNLSLDSLEMSRTEKKFEIER